MRDQSDPNQTRLVEICSRKKKIELEGRGMLERFFVQHNCLGDRFGIPG